MRTAKIGPDLRLRVALHRLARVFSRFFALLFPLCCVVGEVLSPSMSRSNALKKINTKQLAIILISQQTGSQHQVKMKLKHRQLNKLA